MSDETVFRLVLVLGFLAVFPAGLYYRLKAHAAGDRLDRRQEGWFTLLTLRPVAAAGMIGLVLYVINPRWMAWSAVALPAALRWVGAGIGVLAAALLILTLRTLGPNLTDTVVTRERHALVTTGPYRWVRHPFYVATALAVTANAVVAANWFIGLSGALAVALLMNRTTIEERNLRERFGAEYAAYAARTGRFLPRLGRSTGPDHTTDHGAE